MKTYLISYDVSNSKARAKILKILRRLCIGYQQSVFECSLTQTDMEKLIHTLTDIISENDSLLITRMPSPTPHWTLGNAQRLQSKGSLLIL